MRIHKNCLYFFKSMDKIYKRDVKKKEKREEILSNH